MLSNLFQANCFKFLFFSVCALIILSLTGCVSMNVKDVKIPSSVKRVVAQNNGQILTPDNRLKIKPNLEVGYQFRMIDAGRIGKSEIKRGVSYSYRLDKIDGDDFYFSAPDFYGRTKSVRIRKYKYGQLYTAKIDKKGDLSFEAASYEHCLFVIGECSYSSSGGKKMAVETDFRDGVWVSNEPHGSKGKRKIVYRVYKTDGLPLYEYFVFPLAKDGARERVEIDQSYGYVFDVNKTFRGMPVARAVCVDSEETQEVGFEIKLESLDGKAFNKYSRFIGHLEEFVTSDPCMPSLFGSSINQVKGDGWIFDKPEGRIIVDTINGGISAYTVAPFTMGNFEQWHSLTSKRLREHFEPEGIKAYIKVDP